MKTHVLSMSICLLAVGSLIFTGCNDDDQADLGDLSIAITDAPVDDPGIKGVFVTISEIRLDGEAWSGFDGPLTIDLMSLQDGSVQTLGVHEVEARSYQSLQLVLDHEMDQHGEQPGCYVLTQDDTRHNLMNGAASRLTIDAQDDDLSVENDMMTALVIDIDLRKAIRHDNDLPNSDYRWAGNSELSGAVRIVQKGEAGHISGHCSDDITAADKIVVYVYASGHYNDSEMQPQGQDQVRFANAVSSTSVQSNGDFTLAFLEEGSYELVFIAYEEQNNEGSLGIAGMLTLDLLGGADMENVAVSANATASVEVEVTGLIPL